MDLSNLLAAAGIGVGILIAYAGARAKDRQTDASERQTLDRYVGDFEAFADQLAFVWADLVHQDDLDFFCTTPVLLAEIDWQRFSLDEPQLSGFPFRRQELLNDAVVQLSVEIKNWNGEVKSRGHAAKKNGKMQTRLFGMKDEFKPILVAARRVHALLGKISDKRHAESRARSFEKLGTIGLKSR